MNKKSKTAAKQRNVSQLFLRGMREKTVKKAVLLKEIRLPENQFHRKQKGGLLPELVQYFLCILISLLRRLAVPSEGVLAGLFHACACFVHIAEGELAPGLPGESPSFAGPGRPFVFPALFSAGLRVSRYPLRVFLLPFMIK